MKTDNDMSFPAWLWVILGAIALIAGSVAFKMVQVYNAAPRPSAAPPAAVTPATTTTATTTTTNASGESQPANSK